MRVTDKLRRFTNLIYGYRRQASQTDRRAMPTLNEYVRYLQQLGLDISQLSPEEYVDRAAARMGIEIEAVHCDQENHPELYKRMVENGYSGMVLRNRITCDALLVVRKDLSYSQRVKSLLHELEHVVCGHRMKNDAVYSFAGRSIGQILADYALRLRNRVQPTCDALQSSPGPGVDQGEWWTPPREKRLVRAEPPWDPDWAEQEAEKRAELALRAMARGADVYRSDTWLFSRKL